ncbi:sulfurtransferase complex subunit TusC [Neptunomonas qingdaonensis]|uniref:tRNA 2-thiouridine synthesizing protein C n=1 Tax=Neptunomonas qingdaonensis TaxID=1045558 RepID=A0A1I2PEH7_9GAMM|nr:sulfurtransferase complex subunit TusC [Neptunomonas qingdaonensis]SFG13519.1 tRNA 2-thiouridine synthesizing protein C [Neptunomonas qingdaonensis]
MSQKNILLILSHAPYGDAYAKEALDIALTAAAFGLPVSLLLTQDAPYLLLKSQQPQQIQQKNFANICSALPMYDIENIYIEARAAQTKRITLDQLVVPATFVNQADIALMIRDHDVVLRF